MPNRSTVYPALRLGLALCLCAVAFGWGPAPVAAAPARPLAAAISLEITVGTDHNNCATTPELNLTAPAAVTYCYSVTNTGSVTLSQHTLVSPIFGAILTDFPYTLAPGDMAFITGTVTLTATTVTTGTWTAYNDGPVDVVSSTDTVAVSIAPPFACNAPPIAFEAGIPPDWTVIDNTLGAGIHWTTTANPVACGHNNLTNGTGQAACADSDKAGESAPPYDTELVTPQFDLTTAISPTLHLAAFYSDLDSPGNDLFRIDVWNGKGWFTELTWDEEHSNEDIDLDLSTYAGLNDLQVRFRYSGNGFDWYAQVDDVWLSCGGNVYLPLALK